MFCTEYWATWVCRGAVVLANRGGAVLPLVLSTEAEAPKSLALIGPHANTTSQLLGMYVGAGNQRIVQRSALSVLGSRLGGRLEYAPGLPSLASTDISGFAAAAAAARRSTTAVVMLGLCEQGHGCTEHENQDRSTLGLPQPQLALLKTVSAAAASTVCVFISGGPLSVDALDDLCDAALWTGYPGQAGAIGFVDVLLGSAAPTGRLPYTLHWSNFTAARPMTSMAVRPRGTQPGATYRWFGDGGVLRPFGFGISLARFSWSWSSANKDDDPPTKTLSVAAVAAAAKQRTTVTTIDVTGLRLQAPSDQRLTAAGTAAVGVSALGFVEAVPPDGEGRRLFGFTKLDSVLVGQSRAVSIPLQAGSLTVVEPDGSRWVKPGHYRISVDGAGDGAGSSAALTTVLVLTGQSVLVEMSPF